MIKSLSRFVRDVAYQVVEFVKKVLQDPPCPCCAIYREQVEIESQRARYYEQLLLKRLGAISNDEIAGDVQTDYSPVYSRTMTLSQLRRQAERKFSVKESGEIANPIEKTEAEALFEERLNNV